ncbi:MAG: hypothetical protein LBI33_01730, partial [Propionibacteriaceae bacterium]|nr:hypothetical protein [Propionibacteriaceae bacterium]
DIIAIDTDSREQSAAEAGHRVRLATRRAVATGAEVVTKIDSLLRGQVAAEVAAGLAGLRSDRPLAVVAPAFPAVGRTTQGGLVYVDGVSQGAAGDIGATLERGGLATARLAVPTDPATLATSFAQARDRGLDAVVVDAVTDDDLARVLWACRAAPFPVLPVGSGGLTRPYARLLPGGEPRPVHPGLTGPVLTVVGSHTPAARRQLAALRAAGVTAVTLRDDGHDRSGDVSRALTTGAALVCFDPTVAVDERRSPVIARQVAAAVVPCLTQCGTLVATGGATARTILEVAGILEATVLGELEPGVMYGQAGSHAGLRIVTKSGSFGDDRVLIRCLLAATPVIRTHNRNEGGK